MTTKQSSDTLSYAPDQRFALADNMDNIGKIKRMWRAQWPEFSWLTVPGNDSSRCYQMFAPDISRVGYGDPDPNNSNRCPVWAVMCPQQGMWIEAIQGSLNVEVTVTQAGGWVTENPMDMDAQVVVAPKIWFSPDLLQTPLIALLWKLFDSLGLPFPTSKANAIKINTYGVDKKDKPVQSSVLNIVKGQDPNFPVPPFAIHDKPNEYNMVAACVVYLAVEIGEINPTTNNSIVNQFNQLVMDIFNIGSGNLLANGNVLSWNVWALAPEEVYTPEWQMHADYWRYSIDVNHRSPEGSGRNPMYFNGEPFQPAAAAIGSKLEELKNLIAENFPNLPIKENAIREIDSVIAKSRSGAVEFV